jgi:hypothetical protein
MFHRARDRSCIEGERCQLSEMEREEGDTPKRARR